MRKSKSWFSNELLKPCRGLRFITNILMHERLSELPTIRGIRLLCKQLTVESDRFGEPRSPPRWLRQSLCRR